MNECDFCGSVKTGELKVVQDRLDIQYLLCGKKLPAPYGLSDYYMRIEENSDDLANMHAEVSLCKSTRGWLLTFHYWDGDDFGQQIVPIYESIIAPNAVRSCLNLI